MTVAEALKQGSTQLTAAEISSARLDTELLLGHALGKQREWLLAHPEASLELDQAKIYESLIHERSQRRPVVHLTNTHEFYGLSLYISEHVLTPRVETETMAEWAIELAKPNSKLVDLGTGSGALAFAVASHRPDLDIIATEISSDALAVARRNAKDLKLSIKFVQSDLLSKIPGKFSTILSNLPYLENGAELMAEVKREPAVALFGGSDGLDLYRRLFAQLSDHLEAGGWLFTECDPWQQPALIALAEASGLKLEHQDYSHLRIPETMNNPLTAQITVEMKRLMTAHAKSARPTYGRDLIDFEHDALILTTIVVPLKDSELELSETTAAAKPAYTWDYELTIRRDEGLTHFLIQTGGELVEAYGRKVTPVEPVDAMALLQYLHAV